MWYILGALALLILLLGWCILRAAGRADEIVDANDQEERSRFQACSSAPLTEPRSNETSEERI